VVCLVHLVSLVYPVSLVQPNKRDKPNKPEQPAGFHASRVSIAQLAGVPEELQPQEGKSATGEK